MRYMILCITLILAGCAVTPITPPEVRESPFPPLVAIAQGDFDAFLTENQQKQPTCEEDKSCAMVLFNLGFVYAYPYSPHYDRQKALSYFDALLQNYTHTPWALQGRWWRALLHETLTLEAARERLQADLKSYKEAMRRREEALEAREAALRSRESTVCCGHERAPCVPRRPPCGRNKPRFVSKVLPFVICKRVCIVLERLTHKLIR